RASTRTRLRVCLPCSLCLFFFRDPAPTEIYTLSLHDALPISLAMTGRWPGRSGGRTCSDPQLGESFSGLQCFRTHQAGGQRTTQDRKSTRLNSSHRTISYAVFCLKKKKQNRRESNNCAEAHQQ